MRPRARLFPKLGLTEPVASWSRSALVVEDQPFVGMVMSDILRETGFDTVHAYDAADAIEILRTHSEIRLLITEANLPGPISGIALAHRVAKERADIQIIVAADRRDVDSEVPCGAMILRKPFASSELRALAPPKALQHG